MKKIALLRSSIILTILFLTAQFSFSQDIPSKPPAGEFRVTGKVTDEANKPLEGATVQVKGTNNFSVTKRDGSFSIVAPSSNSILVISSVGFREQEVPINGKSQLTLTLVTTATTMQDVVVVGYGTQKKSDVTGAVSRITDKVIQDRPTQNVLQALQGHAAGVHVSSNTKPGELPIVRIRGNRSINFSNDPLYVIDGIPLVNSLGVNSFTMADLNENDVASIEVLKDASATAIYGSRGANGVVLVTTKKGQKGKVTIGYNGSVSFDWYKSLTDWMDGGEYVDRWRLSAINGRTYHGLGTGNGDLTKPAIMWYPNPKDDSTLFGSSDPTAIASVMMGYERNPDGTLKMRPTTAAEQGLGWPAMVPVYNSNNVRSYDWLDAATRQGVTQSHQISLTSGTDVSRFSISLGYYNQLGVQRDQDYKRYTANVTGDITGNKWFTLGASILTSFSLQNFGIQGPNTSNTGSKDLFSRATDQFPYALPQDANGLWIKNPGGINLSLWNPLIDIDQSKNERRTFAVLASVFAEIKFTPWLKYRINFGPQYRHYRSGSWTGPDATSHLKTPNTAGYATEENFSWVVENLLYADKTFDKIHTLGVTLLQSSQKSRRESASTSVTGVVNPLSLWYDLGSNSAGNPSYGSGFTENSLTSFMARVNYTLMNKYLVTASGRYDGSSVLAPDHKWDFFPSFAVAWKVQEEKFLEQLYWINELKLRVGYGITGSSSVNPYSTSGPLSRNPYVFGNAAGIGYLPQLIQNPLLKWERTGQTNIGLDFGLLKNRVSGSIEVYQQNTSDLIFQKTLPATSGYVQKIENIGKTRNKGIELTLSTINVQQGKFSWSTDLNWSKNKEEIVELINGKQDMVANALFIGQPTQVFYTNGYVYAGIWSGSSKDLGEIAKFKANGVNFYPGTIKVVDQNGDYKIDAADWIIHGSPRPKWTGGITNTFRYQQWSLSSFIYFRWGQTYFGGYPNSFGGVNPNGRVENDVWSWAYWDARYPMPNSAVTNFTSSMQYNDGSFWVVRNISLSYTFPKSLVRKAAMNDLLVNVQVLNPFMFGKQVVRWGLNPDDDTNWDRLSTNTNPLGGTNSNTILPQSFVIGIKAGF